MINSNKKHSMHQVQSYFNLLLVFSHSSFCERFVKKATKNKKKNNFVRRMELERVLTVFSHIDIDVNSQWLGDNLTF